MARRESAGPGRFTRVCPSPSTTRLVVFWAVCSLMAGSQAAGQGIEPYEKKELLYNGEGYLNFPFHYLQLSPERVDPGKTYPLVLFLHSSAERGEDPGKLVTLGSFPKLMSSNQNRRKFSCFVIVPQCPEDRQWVDVKLGEQNSQPIGKPTPQMEVVREILKQAVRDLPVDRKRIYLTGVSMGGYGCWDLAMREPDWFAALVPIGGGGDETRADRLIAMPIWNVHGDTDQTVPVSRSRRMIEALVRAGGNPKYTEYPRAGEDCWLRAYNDREGVLPWMFRQMKQIEPEGWED